MARRIPSCIAIVLGIALWPGLCFAADLVVDGKAVATIVVAEDAPAKKGRRAGGGDRVAAETLVDWIRKISGAELPIATRAPTNGVAIYVGAAAIEAGLKLDGIDSPSREGLRIIADEKRILLAGQSGTATIKAACRLLEELGCRYFMSNPLGEVYPRSKSVRVGTLDITEKPGTHFRTIWGSQWGGSDLWKTWNGAGGVTLAAAHSWSRYVPKNQFDQHPEYFALRNGERTRGEWLCTSNAALRDLFAQNVLKAIEAGQPNPSVSPPDGTAYCQCDACRAQDDPASIEPTSDRVNVTNRYVDFLNGIARSIAAKYPDSLLNFYCYADYTQPPTRGLKLEKNLVAWAAPIRYCRFHRIDHPNCPSRRQLQQMLTGWGAAAARVAYRTYNYNLAECVVPFSMISVWKHDVPWLVDHGCIAFNFETLPSWTIYGPHIYLSIRLAYDPRAKADAISMTTSPGFSARPVRR